MGAEQAIAQASTEGMNWWQMLWALLIVPMFSKKFWEILGDIFWKKTLGKLFNKEEKVDPIAEQLRRHEEDDNRRFEDIKSFLRDSENRILAAFEGNTGRIEGQLKDLSTSTARRFESMERTHQDLLFRYVDMVERKKG